MHKHNRRIDTVKQKYLLKMLKLSLTVMHVRGI